MAGRRRLRSSERRPGKMWATALALVMFASACQTQAPTPSATAADIARVEISPTAVLLTAAGESKSLRAVALTADRQTVETPITWSSSDPAVASIDASGTVRATAAVGTTTITAAAGEIRSLPTYVTVAQPVAGAVLLTDSQIVAGPLGVEPAGVANSEAVYEVVLRGVPGAAEGAILISSEGLPVAGRVISTTPEGDDARVRLVVVPPGELFTAVDFKDTIDLGSGPFEIPDDLAAAYDVVQTGSSFEFTPKEAGANAGESTSVGRAVLAQWPGNGGGPEVAGPYAAPTQRQPIPPFTKCGSDDDDGSSNGPMPLSISVPPAFSFTAAGSVDRLVTPAGTQIAVRATPTFRFEVALEVEASFEAMYECKRTLLKKKFRVPGWAGLFFGGKVSFGVGFGVGGKVTLVSAKVGGAVQLETLLEATLDCVLGAACTMGGNASAVTSLEPVFETPSLDALKFEPDVALFAFVVIDAGNADIEALQFEAIEARVGVELGASLTLERLQINDSGDDGRSAYGLAIKGEVGPGLKLGEFLRTVLAIPPLVPLKLSFEWSLGDSPTGIVRSDKARYLPGETVTLKVTLDPATTIFPSIVGRYNVERVAIVRTSGLAGVEVLASLDATDLQREFTFTFTAPGLLTASELYAFVVTAWLPLDPPKLEVGAPTPCLGDPASLTSIDDEPDKIFVLFDGVANCRIVVKTGPGDSTESDPDGILLIDTDPADAGWDAELRGVNWERVAGYGADLPSGTRVLRARHVASGVVYVITVTVAVSLIDGGPNTTMTVRDVSIVPAQ